MPEKPESVENPSSQPMGLADKIVNELDYMLQAFRAQESRKGSGTAIPSAPRTVAWYRAQEKSRAQIVVVLRKALCDLNEDLSEYFNQEVESGSLPEPPPLRTSAQTVDRHIDP